MQKPNASFAILNSEMSVSIIQYGETKFCLKRGVIEFCNFLTIKYTISKNIQVLSINFD